MNHISTGSMHRGPGLPFVRLIEYLPPVAAVQLLPEEIARRYSVVPLWLEEDRLVIATAGPMDRWELQAIAAAARRPVRPLLASYPEVRATLDRIYGREPVSPPRPKLGQLLQQLGCLDEERLTRALAVQTETGQPLGQICLQMGLIEELDLAEALACQHALPHLRLEGVSLQPELTALVPWEVAREREIIPLWWLGDALVVGTVAPEKWAAVGGQPSAVSRQRSAIARPSALPRWPVVCPPRQWVSAFQTLYLRGRRRRNGLDARKAIDILLKEGVLSERDVVTAQMASQQTGCLVEELLLRRGLVTREQWLRARSQAAGVPFVQRVEPEPLEIVRLLPPSLARACSLLPLARVNGRLILGMEQPDDALITLVEALTGLEVEPRLMDPAELQGHLERVYPDGGVQFRPPTPGPRLGEVLITMGLITEGQLEEALEAGPAVGWRLGERLVNLGYLDDVDLAEALSVQTGIPYARLEHARFEEALIRKLPPELARRHQMLPFLACDGDLWVAVADPLDGAGLRAIEQALEMRVWPLIAPRSVMAAAVERFFGAELRRVDSEVRRLVDNLVTRGLLTQGEAATALQRYVAGEAPLDRAIREASRATEAAVTRALAEALRVPWLDLDLYEETVETIDALGQRVTRQVVRDPVDASVARLISLETAQRLTALPVARQNGRVTVAFADPIFGPAVEELEATLGLRVQPALAPRRALEEAIQRVLGRKNIGTYLLLAGLITRHQLNDALELAQRTGVRLGRALVNRGYVTEEQLYQFLAEQAGLPLFDLTEVEIDEAVARLIDPETERALGILPIAIQDGQVTLAMVDPLNTEALEVAAQLTGRAVRPVLVTERALEVALERLYRGEYLARSTSELLERAPEDSAYWVLSRGQKIALGIFLLISALWLAVDYVSYLIVTNALASLFYVSFSVYKFYLVYRALAHDLEVPVSDEEVAALDDRDLPVYTILIPVYKEAEVLPDLLEAVNRLDYPTTKLDIKVLMEADDLDTIEAFRRMNLPSHFQGIIVPNAPPKTKPKACNYGLIHARGEYVVIYDAEDLPEPDQLKKVLVAYTKVPPEVVCIQAKLNYYNRRQNLLTRWFTVEYSMWFDLFLPGLDASDAPIPLGGTSNHFRRDALVEVGAWDPHNVTEDADLGMRLYKRGYKTATVDSTTFEEANSELYNWIRQRSRWHKGYIQTWLVHMRHPLRLLREIGWKPFLSFQLVVAGTFFAALLNPVYWTLTALWFLTQWGLIQEIYPGIIFYLGAISMYFGNFAFTYMNVAGAMRRGYYDIVKYALLSPLYWGLMSVGAWKGFLQLVYKPHFWEKTVHGLYEGEPEVERAERLRDLV